jgi:hypothetical protein
VEASNARLGSWTHGTIVFMRVKECPGRSGLGRDEEEDGFREGAVGKAFVHTPRPCSGCGEWCRSPFA